MAEACVEMESGDLEIVLQAWELPCKKQDSLLLTCVHHL